MITMALVFFTNESQTYHDDFLVRCLLSLSESSWSEPFESEFQNFAPSTFKFKILSHPVFLKRLLCTAFSLDYIELLQEKLDITAMGYKIPKPLRLVPCGPFASYGSKWVHPDAVITTLPNFSPLHIKTTLQNSE